MKKFILDSNETILNYFPNLFYKGIDLSMSLIDAFSSDYIHDRWEVKNKKEFLYYLLQNKYFIILNFVKNYLSTNFSHSIQQYDYILLTFGEKRYQEISFPIVEKLDPSKVLIIDYSNQRSNYPISYNVLNFSKIPYNLITACKEFWVRWKKLKKGLNDINLDFNISYKKTFKILLILTNSIVWTIRSEYVLSKVNPKSIFTEIDKKSKNAIFFQMARSMDIPSVTLVHGLMAGDSYGISMWVPLIADKIIVWGKWMADFFISNGLPSSKIEIGGYPRLDSKIKKIGKTYHSRVINPTQKGFTKNLVFLSSNQSEQKNGLQLFLETKKFLPEWTFIIRPHPQEKIDWYNENLFDMNVMIHDPSQYSLQESLDFATIVVGSGSTSCFDAIILGKPVLLVTDSFGDYSKFPQLIDAINNKIAFEIANAEEFINAIKNLEQNMQFGGIMNNYYCECIGAEAAILSSQVIKNLSFSFSNDLSSMG